MYLLMQKNFLGVLLDAFVREFLANMFLILAAKFSYKFVTKSKPIKILAIKECIHMSQNFSFEDAYASLEKILEKLNSGKASLEDSLKLYEEADQLITSCHRRLVEAEQKIEILMKNRQGELALSESGTPLTQRFTPNPVEK